MKKIACILLALVLVLGMGATAFAAGGWEIDSIYEDFYDGWGFCYLVPQLQQGDIPAEEQDKYFDGGGTDLHLGTIQPGEELWLDINYGSFRWEGPDGEFYDMDNLYYTDEDGKWIPFPQASNRDLRRAGLQFGVQTAQANKIIEGQQFRSKTDDFDWDNWTYHGDEIIKIPFVEELVSTEEMDFEFTFYFRLQGESFSHKINVTGTMENPVIPVESSHEYVDLSDGSIAEANDFVEKIEVDLGNGVSIFTKMFKGKLYYGTASRTDDEKDDVVLRQYPDIDNVLHLNTIGLNSTGDVVKLATDYAKYHVYDKHFNYLGTADQMLLYSDTYYLANKLLDIEAVDEEAEEELSDDEPVDE